MTTPTTMLRLIAERSYAAQVAPTLFRQRHERFRRVTSEYVLAQPIPMSELEAARAAMLDDEARRAREDLTEADLCWRCCMPLGARQLHAILPGERYVITHASCERKARV